MENEQHALCANVSCKDHMLKAVFDGAWQIRCSRCGMRGPYAMSIAAAWHLWDELPREKGA